MITIEKLKIYQDYNGDGDGYARMGDHKYFISDDEWLLIDDLLQDLVLVKGGHASAEYVLKTEKQLKENFDSIEAVNFLQSMAFQ